MICPHGVDMPRDQEDFLFAGAVSPCLCCKRGFGHFGGAPKFCYQCRDGNEEKLRSLLPGWTPVEGTLHFFKEHYREFRNGAWSEWKAVVTEGE